MIASRIIEVIKLINNELNKNELVSLILLYEYYREILSTVLESVQEIPLYILHNFRTFLSEKKPRWSVTLNKLDLFDIDIYPFTPLNFLLHPWYEVASSC